jgi:hypothetical protein
MDVDSGGSSTVGDGGFGTGEKLVIVRVPRHIRTGGIKRGMLTCDVASSTTLEKLKWGNNEDALDTPT